MAFPLLAFLAARMNLWNGFIVLFYVEFPYVKHSELPVRTPIVAVTTDTLLTSDMSII